VSKNPGEFTVDLEVSTQNEIYTVNKMVGGDDKWFDLVNSADAVK